MEARRFVKWSTSQNRSGRQSVYHRFVWCMRGSAVFLDSFPVRRTGMRYSMEQRSKAVEMYVRFDRCAADTMRELGYPSSRQSLATWHCERLAEQRDGVTCSPGERYGRCTMERKQAAVDFYLSHGRNLRRTIRHMGHPSREVPAAWIDELAPGEHRLRVNEISEEQRKQAVPAVVSGALESRQVAAGLGVNDATVRNWKRLMTTEIRESDMGNPMNIYEAEDVELARLREEDAHLRERIRRLAFDSKTLKREIRDLEVEVDISKTTKEPLGKRQDADPEKLTARDKTILAHDVHERTGRSVTMLAHGLGSTTTSCGPWPDRTGMLPC